MTRFLWVSKSLSCPDLFGASTSRRFAAFAEPRTPYSPTFVIVGLSPQSGQLWSRFTRTLRKLADRAS